MSEIKNVPRIVNGDTVIGFTSSKKVKDLGWMDRASLSSWYQDDPQKNHLGLIDLFSSMADLRMPVYKDFFKKGAVLEVNGADGRFTYDLPVVKSGGCYTVVDTSNTITPGIDGTPFKLVLDKPFVPGDILTYDVIYGEQVIVSEDHEVLREGDTWVHFVKYTSNDAFSYFPADKLQTGIQYIKTGHSLGEYSEQFSSITTPDNVGSITCEFVLGNHMGVETFYTMYANQKSYNGAGVGAQRYWDRFAAEQASLGTDEQGNPYDMFFVADLNPGTTKINQKEVKLGSALEYFVLLELMKLESHTLLFQKAGLVNDINGVKRLNEGVIPQVRRGRIIKYGRKGGITKSHIKNSAAYLFASRKDLMPHERRMKFKCGYMAYVNMMALFREEVLAQIEGLSNYLGTDRSLPKSPISGKDLTSLELEPVMFTKVNIPEIGIVEIEYDPSLDYQPMSDRGSQGFYGEGYTRSSYSMVIWDAMDSQYSNARTNLPSGAKLIDGGSNNANVYYVQPEGDSMYWGYQQGRYSPDNATNVVASMKRMGREFFAHKQSASWVRDLSRSIIIELKD